MNKTLVALAAVSTLTLSVALAQQPPASSANTSASQNSSSASQNSSTPAPTFIAAQKPDEWLATTFKGTQVIGNDDVKIGNVDDILFDRTGSVKAVVIGVGGFLGIGSKDVALALGSFQVIPGKDGSSDQLKLAMTKDQLASATEFKPFEPVRPPSAASALSGNPTRQSTSMMPAPKTQ